MTNPWKPTNNLTDDTVLFDAIGKIRESSDKRREIEARVLAENNLASVRQLSHDKVQKFCAIVDAILAEEAEVNTQLFPEDDQNLVAAAGQMKTTAWGTITEAWTKADHNPEKNTTFLGAPKKNPNKGGYKGGAKPEKTKDGYTAMKRIKEEEESVDESLYGTVQKVKKGLNFGQRQGRAIGRSLIQHQNGLSATAAGDTKARAKAYKASDRYRAVANGNGMKFGTRKEEIIEAILEMEGLHSIDQLSESGLDKLEAIVEQVLIDEGYDLQEVSDDLRARAYAARAGRQQAITGLHNAAEKGKEKEHQMHSKKLQRQMDSAAGNNPEKNADRIFKAATAGGAARNAVRTAKRLDRRGFPMAEGLIKKAIRSVAGREMANDRARKRGIDAYSAQNKAFEPGTSEKDRGSLLAASKPRMKAYKKYDAISRGQKAPGSFGTRKEEIVETILAMEGLHSVDQLTESGLDKLDAIVEQVMIDEGWFPDNRKKLPTPNPKGAPRGERDEGDYKNPSGVPNKDVSQAVRNDRKLTKRNNGRFPDPNSY